MSAERERGDERYCVTARWQPAARHVRYGHRPARQLGNGLAGARIVSELRVRPEAEARKAVKKRSARCSYRGSCVFTFTYP